MLIICEFPKASRASSGQRAASLRDLLLTMRDLATTDPKTTSSFTLGDFPRMRIY